MIAGIFYDGSGLGDQLFRYITVRTLAEEKGYEWQMENTFFFKGFDFLDLQFSNTSKSYNYEWATAKKFLEKVVRDEFGNDIRSYDPEINFVEDNTLVDGSFEDDKYWRHNLDNINKWLAVEPLQIPDDTCVIGFRGGEYYSDSNLGLPMEFFVEAMGKLPKENYQVHTDDPRLARNMFPSGCEIIDNQRISHSKHSNMGYNWRAMRYAENAIIPNSAFYIIPRILKHLEDPEAITVAPRFWARRNTKVWSRPSCYYPEFFYI